MEMQTQTEAQMKPNKKYKIYRRLIEGEVVYVGITTMTLAQRKANNGNKYLYEKLKNASIELIEETDDKDRELFWIKYYLDLGCNLINRKIGQTFDSTKYLIEWRKRNPEKIKKINKNWKIRNPEKVKEYKKKYRQKNRDKLLEYGKKYRKKKANLKIALNKSED